jgi:hypothetical protein
MELATSSGNNIENILAHKSMVKTGSQFNIMYNKRKANVGGGNVPSFSHAKYLDKRQQHQRVSNRLIENIQKN